MGAGASHRDPEPSGRVELSFLQAPPPASGPLSLPWFHLQLHFQRWRVSVASAPHCRMDVLLFPAARRGNIGFEVCHQDH